MVKILIGIDDTDNETSRGTGFLSRKLAGLIKSMKLGSTEVITRHQLFVDSRIPYTSQNSSACIEVITERLNELTDFARSFLLAEAAEGSDVGLALARFDSANSELINWGLRAKKEVLTQDEAKQIATENGVLLEGLTGTMDGIIGAMAGIGLRMSGDDGRCIWLKGTEIRDLSGSFEVRDLMNRIFVDQIVEKSGSLVPLHDKINIGDWLRPVLIKNKITIIAEKVNENKDEWKVAHKDYIKSISN